ncbi:MAG TPA: rRNA maturation RNase YbeY [Candidatus Binatia bacterium]|nr:rRNA maturation RNase YbeY [Candidatus Binatia bacterium]
MSVDIVSRVRGRKLPLRRIKRTAERILDFLDRSESELSLALVGNDAIAKLNKKYRRKPKPTDVLSFPAETAANGTALLGDVVISIDKAREQAQAGGWTLADEIDRLLIHGIVHLLGYDHERSPKDARVMRALEKKIARAVCGKRGAALL